jgi:FKBP-type peptidyl-prolyl cis-trans isomerase 2
MKMMARFMRTIEVQIPVEIGDGERMEDIVAIIDAATFISTDDLERHGAIVIDSGWKRGGVKP